MSSASRRAPIVVSAPVTRVVAIVGTPSFVMQDEKRTAEWEVLSLHRSAGGAQPDHAKLVRKLDRIGRRRNLSVSQIRVLPVEIWGINAKGEKSLPLFWGQLDLESLEIDPRRERVMGVAAIRDVHFGEVLRGMWLWNEFLEQKDLIEEDIEFNPRVDGVIVHNRRPPLTEGGYSEETPPWPLWMLPEQSRTETAVEFTFGDRDDLEVLPWTLRWAIRTLCGACNPDEEWIDNPTGEGEALSRAPDLIDIRLPRNRWLPEYLDALLTPHGYGWYLRYSAEVPEDPPPDADPEAERIRPRIVIYRRGVGAKKKLLHPSLGDVSTLHHHAEQTAIQIDLHVVHDEVRVAGAIKQYECTFELFRAWPEEDDSTDLDELTKSAGGAKAFGNVWRKWVLNEAGDYTNLRPEITDVFPLGGIDPDATFVPRRRFLQNCLTWQDAEQTRRRPVFVEWADALIVDDDTEWKPVPPSWGVRVLQDEIGIIFTADAPPAELMNAAFPRVRVTGTVQADDRIEFVAVPQETSPLYLPHRLTVDATDQFHFRKRVTKAEVALVGSVLAEGEDAPAADEADDTTAIQDYAETLRDQRDSVSLAGAFTLFGLRFEFEIGDTIPVVAGRFIYLNRKPAKNSDKFLQIVGIDYDIVRQRTTLHVHQFDAPVFARNRR